MRGPHTLQIGFAAISVACLGVACDSEDQSVTPPARQPQATAAPAAALPEEEHYPEHWWHRYRRDLQLLELIPGYAGSFQEDLEGKSIVVLLENPESQAQVAREVLGSRPWNGLALLPAEIKVVHAQFGLIDLIRWHEIVGPALINKHETVIMAGVDFSRNRVFLGVTADADQAALRNEVQALGIPLPAIVIEVTGPVILHTAGQ